MNIENKKQFATILLAVALGLVAAFLTSQYIKNDINKQTKALAKEYQKKNSVLIKELEFMKRELSKINAQQAALVKENQRIAQLAAQKPAPIIQEAPKEEKKEELVRFSVQTPPGKRALTINIDSLSAVGGLINPGDHVDIIGHITMPQEGKITSILFQDIRVLAVGTQFSPTSNAQIYDAQQKARSLHLTLALTPEEVGLLTFTQAHGKLQLALRRPAEKGTQILKVASWDGLSDYVLDRQGTQLIKPKPKPKIDPVKPQRSAPAEVKPFVEIFRGGR